MTAALPTHDDTMVGHTLADTYRITAAIGVGAMGTVYEAEHLRLKRTVAVKVLADHFREHVAAVKRFHNEARALAMLDHPHIVRILDFAVSKDSRPFLVMERLVGKTVAESLDSGERFSVASTIDIALQVGEALVAAHSEGIFHRDLKPDNIFLTNTGGNEQYVKVLDFGISRLPESEGRRITNDREVLGTPDYMSPEQAQGMNEAVNGRTDQHALALVMYEMLSGISPFASNDLEESLKKVATEIPALVNLWAPKVPLSLATVLHRALAKNPRDRYSGIDEFMRAIVSATQGAPPLESGIVYLPEPSRGSMPVAKPSRGADPVRTVSLILGRTRTAFLKGDMATATTCATTALDTAALVDDEAISAVIELARPLLEGVFHTHLEPMDRSISVRVSQALEGRGEPPRRAAFLAALRTHGSIAEAIHASPLPRLETLRTLLELETQGAIEFRAPVARARHVSRVPASARHSEPVPRLRRA